MLFILKVVNFKEESNEGREKYKEKTAIIKGLHMEEEC
jgi:hypothetical protein